MSHASKSLILHTIGYKYPEAVEPLFTDLNLAFYAGWTGIVGPNGSGKSTLLHLISGVLQPDTGRFSCPAQISCVEQRTDHPPPNLKPLEEARDGEVWQWRSKLGIQDDWFHRWGSLSHGERKRLQIATALSKDPDVLILDEPDNHLDADTRDILLKTLSEFQGVGIIVSHDRYLLDALCTHTLFLNGCEPDLRSGGYTAANQELEREQLEHDRKRTVLHKEEKKLRRELQRRSEESSRTKGKRSRGHLARGDSDSRAKIGMAIYSGKDKKIGRLKQVLSDRVDKLHDKRATISYEKIYRSGIQMGGKAGHRGMLIDEPRGSYQPFDGLEIGWPDLLLERGQRIALTGPNGAGKTLLLEYLIQQSTLPESEILYMPQEIPLSAGTQLLKTLHQLPPLERGHTLTIISRLGSDPEGLLEGEVISPGESRKLLLSLGMGRACSLLVLDEPTNHLDLLAIACLEEALLEWPGAMLLVSHDRQFVSNLAQTVWRLEPKGSGKSHVVMETP